MSRYFHDIQKTKASVALAGADLSCLVVPASTCSHSHNGGGPASRIGKCKKLHIC